MRRWAKWVVTILGLVSMVTGASLKSVLDSTWPEWKVAATSLDLSWLLVALGLVLVIAANWHGLIARMSKPVPTDPIEPRPQPPSEPKTTTDSSGGVNLALTPTSLKRLYAGKTALQGWRLAQKHIGERMRVSGEVQTVSAVTQDHYSVSFLEPDELFMVFPPGRAEDLFALSQGDEIVVEGRIFAVYADSVTLEDCVLVEVRGKSPSEES